MTDPAYSPSEIASFLATTRLFRGLEDEVYAAIADTATAVTLADGDMLFRKGDPSVAFFVVREGKLEVLTDWKGDERVVAEATSGIPLGEVSLMGDRRRTASARAVGPTTVFQLDREKFAALADRFPKEMERIARRMANRRQRIRLQVVMHSSAIFAGVDDAVLDALMKEVELVDVASGSTLCRQGDPSDSVYLVVSGRLRIWLNRPGGGSLFLNEVGPGESVGEMGVITGKPRAAEVRAIRDSTVAKLSGESLMGLLRHYPEVINRVLVGSVLRHFAPSEGVRRGANSSNTFALIPIRPSVPIENVGHWLGEALSASDATNVLTSNICDERFGAPGAAQTPQSDPRNGVLLDWLNEQELTSRYVLLVADPAVNEWTKRCVRQADHVLFVADTDGAPELGEIESGLAEAENLVGVRKSLVLLHSAGTDVPSNTLTWLSHRKIGNHHHVRRDNREDFQRLSRFITGRAVALVLGGGGARGFAHAGVIKALNEARIPIDLVGGTSMGAVIGAECASLWDYEAMVEKTLMISAIEKEFTIPLVSLFRGRKMAMQIVEMFSGTVIEDLWRRYYSVSCNLSRAKVMVHDKGSLGDAVLASNLPPGLFPPQVLDGDLLVDGGLLNNVPLDVMQRYNEGGTMIAVDVNPAEDLLANDEYEFGLSGTQVFFSKLLPFRQPMNVPNIMDIIARSTAIGGLAKRQEVMESGAALYLEPPVGTFPITGHKQGREIAEVGYAYASEAIDAWLKREGAPVTVAA